MIKINYNDEKWWNMCADIYSWHLNGKRMLIVTTIMFSSSFSDSIVIIIAMKWRPCHFQQQITKKMLLAPEHLQSKYHKGQGYVPP